MLVYSDLVVAYFEALASDPSSGATTGRFYLNTTSHVVKWYANSAWHTAMDLDTAQTVTNKTIQGGTVNAVALNAAVVGQYLDVSEVSTPATPGSSKIRMYAKTDKKLYFKDSAGTETRIGGGGSGSGEINLITVPNDATSGWVASGAGITVETVLDTAYLPLIGVVPTAIMITPVSGTDYVRYRFRMSESLKGRKLKMEWEQRHLDSYATGDLKVEIYTNSASDYSGSYTEVSLSTDDSGGTSPIPARTGKYTTYYTAGSSADYYELRIVRTGGTSALSIAAVVSGPGIQPQGAVIQDPLDYTPAIEGFGTITDDDFQYTRYGSRVRVEGRFTSGTATATTALIPLPNSWTCKTPGDVLTVVGRWARGSGATTIKGGPLLADTSNGYVTFGNDDYTNGGVPTTSYNGSTVANSGEVMLVWFDVATSTLVGSGTVDLLQQDNLTDWHSFTPTGTWTTNTTYTGMKRRVGDTLEMDVQVALGGAPDATTLKLNLPSGLTIDTSKLLNTTSDNNYLGEFTILDSGTNYYHGKVYYGSTTQFNLIYLRASQTNLDGTTNIGYQEPITFASGDRVWIKVRVPILEWANSGTSVVGYSSASATSSGFVDTGTQTFAGIKNNGSMPAFRAIPSGTLAHYVTDGIVKFNSWTDSGTDAFDQGSNFASSRFTVPNGADGIYSIQANMAWDGGAGSVDDGDSFQVILRKNGTGVAVSQQRAALNNQDINAFLSTTLSLVAGDYLEIFVFTSSATNVTTLNSGSYAWFSGHKLY